MSRDLAGSVSVPCKIALSNIIALGEIKEKLTEEFQKRGIL